MRRRTFLAGVACVATQPHRARAQRLRRLGYLGLAPAEPEKPLFEAFKAGLSELGYIPGKTIEIEFRTAEGRGEDRMAELARELVDLKVDIIVTGGPGVIAAYKVTKTLPIVMLTFGDIEELVAVGIVAGSLAHPGGTVTGQTFLLGDMFLKRIELLRQAKPTMTRVGALVLRGSSLIPFAIPVLDAKVKALGLGFETIEVADPADCDRALSAGPGASIGALMVTDMPQFVVGPGPAVVASAALRRGVPAAGPGSIAENGGLIGYGADIVPMFRRAAVYVDKILKGTRPGDIPIEQATKFVTIVNLKTARALGLELPPTLLAAADRVIE